MLTGGAPSLSVVCLLGEEPSPQEQPVREKGQNCTRGDGAGRGVGQGLGGRRATRRILDCVPGWTKVENSHDPVCVQKAPCSLP